MKYYFLIFILIPFYTLTIEAQETSVDAKTLTSLYFVYGWEKNQKNEKWTVKEKEIKEIDKFKSYTISSYTLNSKNYIAITKLEEVETLHIFNTYIIDLQ